MREEAAVELAALALEPADEVIYLALVQAGGQVVLAYGSAAKRGLLAGLSPHQLVALGRAAREMTEAVRQRSPELAELLQLGFEWGRDVP